MGLPVTTAAVTKTGRLEIAVGQWSRLHNTAAQIATLSVPASVLSARRIFDDLLPALALARDALISAKAVPNMAAFATNQFEELGYTGDIVVDANATGAAIDSLITLLTANASTIYGRYTVDATGQIVIPVLTTGEKAALKTQLDALVATFN